MPGMLATCAARETTVIIPATLIFRTGDLHQLWLVARKSRRHEPPQARCKAGRRSEVEAMSARP